MTESRIKTPAHIELFYDEDWHDLTIQHEIYTRDPITISRGRQDELSRISPAEMNLSIKNTGDHKYSPRNPNSPLYGKIGRNQPIRCWVQLFRDDFSRVESNQWGFAPDGEPWQTFSVGGTSADFDVNGSEATHIVDGASEYRASVLGPPSFPFRDCEVRTKFDLSTNSVSGGPIEPANLFLRYVNTTTYYFMRVSISTGEAVSVAIHKVISGSESILASAVTVSGLTFAGQPLMAAFACEGPILMGKVWDPAVGEPHGWQRITIDRDLTDPGHVGVRTGVASGNINLPLTASYDFFEVRLPRVYAEVESWPQRWNIRGTDVWAPVKCNGILYRLGGAGSKAPARSSIHRFVEQNQTALVGYYPMDDPKGSTEAASYQTGPPFKVEQKSPLVGASGTIAIIPEWRAAQMAPHLAQAAQFERFGATGGTDNPSVRAELNLPDTEAWAIDVVFRGLPSATPPSIRGGRIDLNGELRFFLLDVPPNITVWSQDLSDIPLTEDFGEFSVPGAFENDDLHVLRMYVTEAGGLLTWSMWLDGVQVASDTSVDRPMPPLQFFAVGGPGLTEVGAKLLIGHVMAWAGDAADIPSAASVWTAVQGHVGETAWGRIERLSAEEGIPFTANVFDTTQMGAQGVKPVRDLMFESADANDGILFEPRSFFGLGFHGFSQLQNQSESVVLDFAVSEVGHPLNPTEDTDHVQNDVTVTRIDGASSQVVQNTGPLNVQEPADDPQGVGRYPVDYQLSLFADSQTFQQAAWKKHVGTWDEPRYPIVKIDLSRLKYDNKIALMRRAASLNVGERLVIDNPPIWQGPDSIDQRAQGFVETLASHHWTIETNTTPNRPWQVGVLGTNRLDVPAGTTISEDLTTTETGITVPTGIFSTTSEPYDVIVGGEVMTVTSATSTVLTVTRSVNGVVKTHTLGDEIRIYQPLRLARGD